MRTIRFILVVMATLTTQQAFAQDKACDTVANACLAAGFVRTESPDKGIWRDCMKPIMLGKTVSGVTVDSAVAESCRKERIEELKMEIKELEK